MKKLILAFIAFPLASFSQFYMSTNFAEITDASKEISSVHLLNSFYIGSLINDDLILGITTEPAVVDYIENGYNPVQDSLIVSSFQIFFKRYIDNYFILVRIPAYTNFSNISISDQIRVGMGHVIYRIEKFNFEISYSTLLNPNKNGLRKGELSLGVSTNLSSLISRK